MVKYSEYFNDKRTKSTPKFAIEECHQTRLAIKNPPYYTFHVPPTWHTIPSQNKSIGLRRFFCAPQSYHISVCFTLYTLDQNAQMYIFENFIKINVIAQSENTSEEIMCLITDQFNQQIITLYGDDPKYTMSSRLSKTNEGTPIYELHLSSTTDQGDPLCFKITSEAQVKFNSGAVETTKFDDGYRNFNKFFNQPLEQTYSINDTINLHNVWDRRALYVHSDIASHTSHSYLCRSGDFYHKPSKIYVWTDPSPNFRIWFSFDGVTPVSLLYEEFILELCYLADVNDNFAT